MQRADYLIVGGGVIGLAIARELRRRNAKASIVLLEKEDTCGDHASGRNSGVIHAGFYYTADSLKARFTRAGNLALIAYCEEKKIPLNRCGKIVVAQSAADLPQLDELLKRGAANGVPVQGITEEEAREIEPRVKTFQRAIWSPSTTSADPREVLRALQADAERENIRIVTGQAYLRRQGNVVFTKDESFEAGHFINAAGLYADKVAQDFGFSENYRILPFKGLYLYSDEPAGTFRTNIYPVPDLRNPFLGVHFTVRVDGKAKIGPTAIPAFWREQYAGFDNFQFGEFIEVLFREAGLLFSANFNFRELAVEELQKYSRSHLVKLAGRLAQNVETRDYHHWGPPGIRAQLLNLRKRQLEMDFVLEGDEKSTHILNAVSPGWTCALPFASYVCDRVKSHHS